MLYLVALVISLGLVSGAPSQNQCMNACPFIYDPVCDADGNMYDNACMLQNAVCNSGDVKLTMCTFEYNPVCGSNGKTYGNQCQLDGDSCLNVYKESDGPCPEVEVVEEEQRRRGVSSCNEICTDNYDPVCGSDGNLYSNACELALQGCLTNGVVSPIACYASYVPVCGSDGKTYGNDCVLGSNSCFGVTKEHDGECRAARETTNCQTICPANYSPVCGSDGVKYSNQCTLDIASCESGGAISSPICPMNYSPVCGSDGHSYGNQCELDAQKCKDVENADWSVCSTTEKKKRTLAKLLRSLIRQ